jgi:hypothetical protein
MCRWVCSLNLCSEHLRHTVAHRRPPKRTVHKMNFAVGSGVMILYHECLQEPEPYDWSNRAPPVHQPIPPPYTVLANRHTEPAIFSEHSEMKLYPPVYVCMHTYSRMCCADVRPTHCCHWRAREVRCRISAVPTTRSTTTTRRRCAPNPCLQVSVVGKGLSQSQLLSNTVVPRRVSLNKAELALMSPRLTQHRSSIQARL